MSQNRSKLLAVWDWAGRFQLLWGLIGSTVTFLIAKMLEAPGWAVFAMALVGGCLSIGAAILWQQYKLWGRKKTHAEILYPEQPWYLKFVPKGWQSLKRSSFASDSAPLEIKFENVIGKRFYTWQMETENGKEVNVQRCSILLENKSDCDFKNVSVKLERAISLGPREQALPLGYLGYDLRLDQQGTTLMAGDKVWVPLISYRKGTGAWISIESVDQIKTSTEGKLFSPWDGYELQVVVRTDEGVGAAKFIARVDENGQLTMDAIEQTT